MNDHPTNHGRRGAVPDIEPRPGAPYYGPTSGGYEADLPPRRRTSLWAWVALAAVAGSAAYLRLEGGGTLGAAGASIAPTEAPAASLGVPPVSTQSAAPPDPTGLTNDLLGRMEYVDGDGQDAEVGTMLPAAFSVQVMDAGGRPLVGVEVRFRVVSGGGLASPSVVRSDSSGRASTRWQLGARPGFHRLAASAPGVPTPVTFTAIAHAAGASAVREEEEPLAGPRSGAGGAPPERALVLSAPDEPGVIVPGVPAARRQPRSVVVVASDLVVGGSMVCVLLSRRVTCRGAADRGQRMEWGAAGSRAVVAGLFHLCVLDAAGVASCWGANQSGQLGDGSRTDRSEPVRVATPLGFSMLSAGAAHTCGLADGGQLACWGENLGGQLGDGSREDRVTPASVSTPTFEAVVAGWNHTCAVTRTGVLYCWGLNRDGQVGDGSRLDGLTPKPIASSVGGVAAGNSHTCATSGGRLLCWGDNRFGQLGDGTTESRLDPTPVTGLPGAPVRVVAGASHTCALLSDGTAHCWGQNLHGQLGDASTTNAARPGPVAGGLVFARLVAGGAVTCGRTVDGAEYCWGLNQSGQLGDGTLDSRPVPTRVGG